MSTPHYGSKSLAAAVRAHRSRGEGDAAASAPAAAAATDHRPLGESSTTGTTVSLHRLAAEVGGSTTLTTSAVADEEEEEDASPPPPQQQQRQLQQLQQPHPEARRRSNLNNILAGYALQRREGEDDRAAAVALDSGDFSSGPGGRFAEGGESDLYDSLKGFHIPII